MTPDRLPNCTRDELVALARKHRLTGWSALSKAELVRALRKKLMATGSSAVTNVKKAAARSAGATAPAPSASKSASSGKRNGHTPVVTAGKRATPSRAEGGKSVSRAANGRPRSASRSDKNRPPRETLRKRLAVDSQAGTDSIELSWCNDHWLRVTWSVSRENDQRTEQRLGADCHNAVPVVRLYQVSREEQTHGNESLREEVEIRGGATTWYLFVESTTAAYRVHIGYRTAKGRFVAAMRSGVSQPAPLSLHTTSPASPEGAAALTEAQGEHYHRLADRIALRRTEAAGASPDFEVRLAAEFVLRGSTEPGTAIELHGTPVTVREDGSFSVCVDQPEGRNVLALTAVNRAGREMRTFVIGVERNTRELEPQQIDFSNVDETDE